MKTLIIVSLLVLGTVSLHIKIVSAQSSGCYFNDKLYPIGTRIGSYVCTRSGWQRVN